MWTQKEHDDYLDDYIPIPRQQLHFRKVEEHEQESVVLCQARRVEPRKIVLPLEIQQRQREWDGVDVKTRISNIKQVGVEERSALELFAMRLHSAYGVDHARQFGSDHFLKFLEALATQNPDICFRKRCNRLNLSKFGLGPNSCKVISSFLIDFPFFSNIDLSRNAIGNAGITNLIPFLSAPPYRDESPALDDKNMVSDFVSTSEASVGNASPVSEWTWRLDLRGNDLSLEGVAQLSSALGPGSRLGHLNLAYVPGWTKNILGSAGGFALARGLAGSYLRVLDLGGMDAFGVTAFTKGLKGVELPLRVLDVGGVGLPDAALAQLCRRLTHSRVQQLSLAGSPIGSKGLSALCNYVRASHSLQRLDLANSDLKAWGPTATVRTYILTCTRTHMTWDPP
jgi:hypothetical protein